MKLRRICNCLCVLLAALPAGARAAWIDWQNETLSGDWNGRRSAWSERGTDLELVFKGTLMANPTGGAKRGREYMQNLELKLGLDTTKQWDIEDSSAYLHLLLNNGGKMNASYVGSQMGVDNSEVAQTGAKLFQAWFNKNFLDSTLSVLAGVYPVDTEFYVTESSGVFLHPSFGMAAEVGQTGRNGPSIYPLAALGARVKYQPVPTLYVQAALLEGDPGEGRHPHWTKFDPFHGDGSVFFAEAGYRPSEAGHVVETIEPEKRAILTTAERLEERYEPIGKYAIGYWSYSNRFDDQFENDAAGNPVRRHNRGAYLLMEKSLYRAADMTRDLAAFVRYGRAEKDVNVFDYSASAGLVVRGVIDGRYDDFFGIAATRSHASAKYRLAQAAAGIGVPTAEIALEATYRAQLRPWLALQPVLQRILNPGVDASIRHATVVGVRCEISF